MPDPVYHSVLVTQVVNRVLSRGSARWPSESSTGRSRTWHEKTGNDPVAVLKKAVENVRPELEVRSRRVGGATYQVPVEVRPRRATTLAIRWLVGFSQQRREKTMAERLSNEIRDAANGIGATVKRKEEHPQDGGVQQGVRPLPLVAAGGRGRAATTPHDIRARVES